MWFGRTLLSFVSVAFLALFAIWLWPLFAGGDPAPVAVQAPAQDAVMIRTSGNALRVRSAPDLSDNVISSLANGEAAWVCERKNDWIRLESGTVSGWVSARFTQQAQQAPERRVSQACAPALPQVRSAGTYVSRLQGMVLRLPQGERIAPLLEGVPRLAFIFAGPAALIFGLQACFLARSLPSGNLHAMPIVREQASLRPGSLRTLCWLGWIMVTLMLLLAFLTAPPRSVVIQKGATMIAEAGEPEQLADLVYRQKSIGLTHLFPFFPTVSDLELASQDRQKSWRVSDAYRDAHKPNFDRKFAPMKWRYFVGVPWLAALAGAGFWSLRFGRLCSDALTYRSVLGSDTFQSYRDFINAPGRTEHFRKRAARRMNAKLNRYVAFLTAITKRQKSAPLRDWFIALARRINPKHPPRVQISFERNKHLTPWRKLMENHLAALTGAISKVPPDQVEELRKSMDVTRRQLAYENVHEFSSVSNKQMFDMLEKVVASTLTSIFTFVFTDKLLNFGTAASTDKLRVVYDIQTQPNLFCKTDVQTPEESRDWFAGILFNWKFDAQGPRGKGAATFKTNPARQFSTRDMTERGVFVSMAVSAFVAMGKEFLNSVGLAGDAEAWKELVRSSEASAAKTQESIKSLIDEAGGEILDAALEDHQREIELFLSSLHAHFETVGQTLMTQLLSEIDWSSIEIST